MTTPTTELGRQCIRLSVWADAVPPHARAQVAARLDTLAALLGQLCAATPRHPEPDVVTIPENPLSLRILSGSTTQRGQTFRNHSRPLLYPDQSPSPPDVDTSSDAWNCTGFGPWIVGERNVRRLAGASIGAQAQKNLTLSGDRTLGIRFPGTHPPVFGDLCEPDPGGAS